MSEDLKWLDSMDLPTEKGANVWKRGSEAGETLYDELAHIYQDYYAKSMLGTMSDLDQKKSMQRIDIAMGNYLRAIKNE